MIKFAPWQIPVDALNASIEVERIQRIREGNQSRVRPAADEYVLRLPRNLRGFLSPLSSYWPSTFVADPSQPVIQDVPETKSSQSCLPRRTHKNWLKFQFTNEPVQRVHVDT